MSMGSVTSYDLTSRANIINMKFENNNSSEFEDDEVFEDPDSEKKQKIATEVKKQPKPAPRHSRQRKQNKQADSVLTGSSGGEQVSSLKRFFKSRPWIGQIGKKSLICLEGKSMSPGRGTTIFFRSSQHLPRLRLGPLKGFLS